MNNREKLFDKINKSIESDNSTLPIFSAVSVKIQIELIKDDPDILLIEKLISEDQSLSSNILKVANSALFSGIVETTTVRSAIMRLGMAEIMQIVVNDISNNLFSSPDQRLDRIMKQLWQHSVACAYCSSFIASHIKCGIIREEAFSAGLFHDIGKLLILKIIEQKKKFYKILDIPDELFHEVLAELHAKHGFMLMKRMKLPKIYPVIARDHHKKILDSDNKLLVMVRLANHICHNFGIGMVHENNVNILETEEAQSMKISEELLAQLQKFLLSNPAITAFTGKF